MKQKAFYPVNLDLHQKHCLVVGGGDIAEHKAQSLLSFGARVTVVSPELKKSMAKLVSSGKVSYVKGKYQLKHLKGVFLVIASTDDVAVNTRVARDTTHRNLLVNVVDVPALCNFIVPSVIRRGSLVMGISTGGQSPMFAQQLRIKCEKCITPVLGTFIGMMGAVRAKVQAKYPTMSERKAVYRKLIDAPVLSLLEEGKMREAKKLFSAIASGKSIDVSKKEIIKGAV